MSFKVLYSVGTRKGIDHGYLPIIEQNGGVPDVSSGYSIGHSLDNYMKWIWRIKKWQASGTFSWTQLDASGHNYGPFSLTFTLPNNSFFIMKKNAFPTPPPMTREIDIPLSSIGFPSDGLVYNTPPVLSPAYPGYSVVSGESAFSNDSNLVVSTSVIFEKTTKQFWPVTKVKLFVQATFNNGVMNVTTAATFTSFLNFGGEHPTIDNLALDGQSCPTFFQLTEGNIHNPTALNMTITPVEFWPYINSMGQPIYDTNSGVELTDPFS